MLMNFLTGAGYWMFSGFANVGDWADVINGWEPHVAWRIGMSILGSVSFMGLVILSLKELGKLIGGTEPELYKRAFKLGLISYLAPVIVVILAGQFNPYGFWSLPVTAGLAAALGGMSPLIWMMGWFQAPMFNPTSPLGSARGYEGTSAPLSRSSRKISSEPLTIYRNWNIIIGSFIIVLIYAIILGRTIYF